MPLHVMKAFEGVEVGYSSTYSKPHQRVEVNSQLHIPAALPALPIK
jgi:hypothetical protein